MRAERRVAWVDAVLRGEAPSWSAVGAPGAGVLDLCDALEISGLVHHRLAQRREHDWPDAVHQELARRAHSAAARELVRAHEIEAVLRIAGGWGVHPILFKGAALAHTVYESPSLRPHADTDLFILRDDVIAAKEIFAANGYVEPSMSEGELVFCQFQMMKVDRFDVQHVFDIHWRISTQTLFADTFSYHELAADAAPVPRLGVHARTVIGTHALLLACIHPVMHHRNTERLIWLQDIDLLVRRLSTTELLEFAQLAVQKHVAGICARQLALTAGMFRTPVPTNVLAILTSGTRVEPSARYLRPRRRWHHELLWNVRGLGRWSERLRLLREVLFPSARYMLNAYHLGPAGVVLLPALYVHRCVDRSLQDSGRTKMTPVARESPSYFGPPTVSI